jgi:hypothetical protein
MDHHPLLVSVHRAELFGIHFYPPLLTNGRFDVLRGEKVAAAPGFPGLVPLERRPVCNRNCSQSVIVEQIKFHFMGRAKLVNSCQLITQVPNLKATFFVCFASYSLEVT